MIYWRMKKMKDERPSYNEIHSAIKDLLYKPFNEKLFKYAALEITTLILMALDVIMERLGEENV